MNRTQTTVEARQSPYKLDCIAELYHLYTIRGSPCTGMTGLQTQKHRTHPPSFSKQQKERAIHWTTLDKLFFGASPSPAGVLLLSRECLSARMWFLWVQQRLMLRPWKHSFTDSLGVFNKAKTVLEGTLAGCWLEEGNNWYIYLYLFIYIYWNLIWELIRIGIDKQSREYKTGYMESSPSSPSHYCYSSKHNTLIIINN